MADRKKKGRKSSLTPEEIILRSIRAKRRFKAIARLVIANLPWLQDIDADELGDDVKRNVALLTQKKGAQTSLTIKERSVLNKPAEDRTEEEKTFLNRIIGGLKCFRTYPVEVKKQLAGVTYFVYFGPGRVIVKQDHRPYALYFIMSGEVTVTQTKYDHLLNEYDTKNLGTIGPGNMFGEVALLHDIPRPATITTSLPSEFLILKKTEFDLVLKATVQQQWDLVKNAMFQFEYFRHWDEGAVRDCCIVSKMQNYPPELTILGDGYGLHNYVYFILKGTCKVVDDLMVTVYNINGKKVYKQYRPREKRRSMFDKEFKTKISEPASEQKPEDSKQAEVKEGETDKHTMVSQDAETQNVGSPPNVEKPEAVIAEANAKRHSGKSRMSTLEEEPEEEHFENMDKESPDNDESSMLPTLRPRPPVRKSVIGAPQNVEHHFIQVCILHPTACFGSAIECLQNRRIVAVTPVECLLIPTYWLRIKNRDNQWTRILQFLDKTIPSREQIFQEFLATQKWNEYKKSVTSEIISKRKCCLSNSIHNVPYSIRLTDDLNFK